MKKNKSLFILCLFFLVSCGEYEKLEIEKEAQRTSDSLFRSHRDSFKVVFDDLCEEQHDSIYKIYFDSLRVTEVEKIQQLLKR